MSLFMSVSQSSQQPIMKKLIFILIASLAPVLSMSAQVFQQGDRKVSLTAGIGVISFKDKARATFDQHLSVEWGVMSLGDKLTLGAGLTLNNAWGGQTEGTRLGTYDYNYSVSKTTYKKEKGKWKRVGSETTSHHREGNGTAVVDCSREDVNLQLNAALHYAVNSRLDTYAKVGVGAGIMTYIMSNPRDMQGFSKNVTNKKNSETNMGFDMVYSYNDLDHVEWAGAKTKVVPAFSVFLGATYMLNDRWGVDAQAGLVSAQIKGADKGYPNSYGVFAVGATYKF